MGAEQIAFLDTLEFIAPRLDPKSRVLEVGAGGGEVASMLAWRGFEVTALDREVRDSLSEAAAQNPKLKIEQRDFLAFEVGDPRSRFDAVLFTRSLHHISPLEDALDRALEALVPGGTLVAEEFSVEAPDVATAGWYYETQDLLVAAGLLDASRVAGAPGDEPRERWRIDHEEDPPLNSGAHMIAEISARFDALDVMSGPYLFRTFAHRLDREPRGEAIVRHLLDVERRGIARGDLRPVGLRMQAFKRR
jgi:SAM-dependent methyltransferase